MRDFFRQQEQAKLNTVRLFPWFVLAVFLTAVALYLFCLVIYWVGTPILSWFWSLAAALGQKEREVSMPTEFWLPKLFYGLLGLTVLIVLTGSFCMLVRLRKGGSYVAESIGGTLVHPDAESFDERRLLNVVEEMAIASGIPVPEVFVLEREAPINAFAAGNTVRDAAVGVTRGSLRYLTRDELQGIMAHEFSHILNGDMRLNLRLMGLVHGIFWFTLLAEEMMTLGESRAVGDKTWLEIVLDLVRGAIGIVIAFIGFNGAYFGRVIKSAVSREREFLADAAAVQFTRYPDGLAGALKKAESWAGQTATLSPAMEEVSHLFFNNLYDEDRSSWTSTHPPVAERVRRLDPLFNQSIAPKEFTLTDEEKTQSAKPAAKPKSRLDEIPIENIVQKAGVPTDAHLEYATGVMEALPTAVRQAARKPFRACALAYCLLLAADEKTRTGQLKQLRQQVKEEVFGEVTALMPETIRLDDRAKIPLAATTFPALRRLTGPQYDEFSAAIQMLVQFDQQVDVFEFALQRMLRRHLDAHVLKVPPPTVKYKDLKPLLPSSAVLFSVLAYVGADNSEATEFAFRAAGRFLSVPADWLDLVPLEQCGFAELEGALDQLEQATPSIKNQVLNACLCTVTNDQIIRVREAEMIRAIADALDCPVPPFVAALEA